MKNILACSRLLSGDLDAAKSAFNLARHVNGNVFLMNLKDEHSRMLQTVLSDGIEMPENDEFEDPEDVISYLTEIDSLTANVPVRYIGEQLGGLEDHGCSKVNLVITKSEKDDQPGGSNPALRFRSLGCPVLKLNPNSPLALPKKIAYVTDLRYFDRALFSPFFDIYKELEPEILVVHVTASGLPDMENSYAESLFANTIAPRIGYKNISLINLLGQDTINDMQNVSEVMNPDMLVLGSRIPGYYDRLLTGEGANSVYAGLPVMLFN